MRIQFACPECGRPGNAQSGQSWRCPACDHAHAFSEPDASGTACPLCDCREIYKKKDFPHWLGLTILIVASVGFLLGHYFYVPRLAWAILIGSAIIDGVMYLRVGDVLVCYSCGAHLRGIPVRDIHHPFDLGTAEKYRQERIRRDQLDMRK